LTGKKYSINFVEDALIVETLNERGSCRKLFIAGAGNGAQRLCICIAQNKYHLERLFH